MNETKPKGQAGNPRRDFLKAAAVAAGAVVATQLPALPKAYAEGADEIRIGQVGCGGRGTGAMMQALKAAPNVKLVALADVFQGPLDRVKQAAEKVGQEVAADHCFLGFDAYQKLLALPEVNYVILASPPGFRALHLKAAVKAGKHIFAEKPVCVDGPTARQCLEAYEEATAKKLSIVCGTQRRHSQAYRETVQRVRDGAIGEIVAGRAYWMQGDLASVARTEKMTDLEWQIRNWWYFLWLSGDHIVEQHVHNIDVINWYMDAHPKSAVSLAGRQVRVEPRFGHIYDHFVTEFEYETGAFMLSMCRQIEGCHNNESENVIGRKGRAQNMAIRDEKGGVIWKFEGKAKDPYTQEHTDLIESIRKGEPLNELKTCTESCLTAIMGRMSAYTGQKIAWDQALNSKQKLMPDKLEWDMKLPVPPVAVPGTTEFM
ncbi:MAG: Gfo/Idh/MocA family oxidoreductase [Planctomycetota bacterium]|nr:Gfo/Idh/MocA family oxidoreductase [Planctomycetota bacterium]